MSAFSICLNKCKELHVFTGCFSPYFIHEFHLNSEISILLCLLLCFIHFTNLQRIKGYSPSLMLKRFVNVYTVRKEEATWSGWLPCALFQSLPSGIPLPQPIVIAILHSPKQSLCSALHSKMSVQKRRYLFSKS